MSDSEEHKDERKFFTWFDVERILKTVSRDPVDTGPELLAFLRAHHTFAMGFSAVHNRGMRTIPYSGRSPLGVTVYRTLQEIIKSHGRVLAVFPQEDFGRAMELLEGLIPPYI